jgi:hypothetical protein
MQELGKFFYKTGATYEGEYINTGGSPKPPPSPEPAKKGMHACSAATTLPPQRYAQHMALALQAALPEAVSTSTATTSSALLLAAARAAAWELAPSAPHRHAPLCTLHPPIPHPHPSAAAPAPPPQVPSHLPRSQTRRRWHLLSHLRG